MANEILQKQGKDVTWAASGGDEVLTLTSLATVAGRKGDVHDFGATFSQRCRVKLKTDFATSPTAGDPVEVYWASSEDNSDFDSGTAQGDAAFTDTDLNKQLHLVGILAADASTVSQGRSWVFDLPARYGYPVVYNGTGQSLSSTAADHELVITPLVDEIQ